MLCLPLSGYCATRCCVAGINTGGRDVIDIGIANVSTPPVTNPTPTVGSTAMCQSSAGQLPVAFAWRTRMPGD
jgi:hypothetical protein